MRNNVAASRYLDRHIEPGLPGPPIADQTPGRWHYVLVIPVYRESAEVLARLATLNTNNSKLIVILVINRPDSDPDTSANDGLRAGIEATTESSDAVNGGSVSALGEHIDLYVHDLEKLSGATRASEGVGLARKVGCDIAFKWMQAGVIGGEWIACTDADATLPHDYFLRLDDADRKSVASLSPFTHIACNDPVVSNATALYELRLHHYVLGLKYAGSPYAFHTLGSCLQIRASAYAHCRGFPKRSGAEDFYLLNKLRKLGEVTQNSGECIRLAARDSSRVPFGTGPAVTAIIQADEPENAEVFYHPAIFRALQAFLNAIPALYRESSLENTLAGELQDEALLKASLEALDSLGVLQVLDNFREQSKDPGQFEGQMQRWFDGFRTLKFLHALRDAGWPSLSLAQTFSAAPNLWPGEPNSSHSIDDLRSGIYAHLGWTP